MFGDIGKLLGGDKTKFRTARIVKNVRPRAPNYGAHSSFLSINTVSGQDEKLI